MACLVSEGNAELPQDRNTDQGLGMAEYLSFIWQLKQTELETNDLNDIFHRAKAMSSWIMKVDSFIQHMYSVISWPHYIDLAYYFTPTLDSSQASSFF